MAASKTASTEFTVARLTHAGINDICGLFKRVWDSFEPALGNDLIKSWKPSPLEFTSWMERITYFVALRGNTMVGAVGCEIDRGHCRLVHLAVDPEARRKGVGTALVGAGIDWARHSNTHQVYVEVLGRFTAAQQLFARLGFQETGTLHRHHYNEDVRLFEKVL